jgi:hypothetical protein
VEILNMIDDPSRLCVTAKVSVAMTSRDVVRAFTRSAGLWGYPASVLSDNGAVLTTSYCNGVAAMGVGLLALGIEMAHTGE